MAKFGSRGELGEKYDVDRDHSRSEAMRKIIHPLMLDMQPHTNREIEELVGGLGGSAMRRLRELRDPEFGNWNVEERPLGGGIHEYQINGHNKPKKDKPLRICVAGTEPKALRAIADKVTNKYEKKYGVDVYIEIGDRRAGIQRKELKDFIASVQDGRLTREVAQMAELDIAMLVIEGTPRWSMDGALVQGKYGARWSFSAHYKYLWSVRARGVWVEGTSNLDDTIDVCKMFAEWFAKEDHTALDQRGSAPKNSFGHRDHEAWQIHILQGFPGVGVGLAKAIIAHFDGVPLEWQADVDELMEVPGIGKMTAEAMWEAL